MSGNVVTTVGAMATNSYWYCVDRNVLKYHGQTTNLTDNALTYVLTK